MYGKTIAKCLEKHGISVVAGDYRHIDTDSCQDADLLIVGCPIFYLKVPENFALWLKNFLEKFSFPAGAAYISHGGTGGGTKHVLGTLCSLLASHGTRLLNTGDFGNMSTFSPTWSLGNTRRILAFSNLPNEETFKKVMYFAERTYTNAESDRFMENNFPSVSIPEPRDLGTRLTKWVITRHTIDENCIHCGICTRNCPVGAIDDKTRSVDRKACIACFGCVNNCPTGAMHMSVLGKRLTGFRRFCQKHDIDIKRHMPK
jgi:ferredoxin